MKGACNDAAAQAGDITAGITLANICGGRLTKKTNKRSARFWGNCCRNRLGANSCKESSERTGRAYFQGCGG